MCAFNGNNLYSMKATSRDDPHFCLISYTSRLCNFSSCKGLLHLVTAVSDHAELKKFSCKHLDQEKQSVGAFEEYNFPDQQISEYAGGSDI